MIPRNRCTKFCFFKLYLLLFPGFLCESVQGWLQTLSDHVIFVTISRHSQIMLYLLLFPGFLHETMLYLLLFPGLLHESVQGGVQTLSDHVLFVTISRIST